jgi:hypothetical protein
MIFMELEVETLISLSTFNLASIVETWRPLEDRDFSPQYTFRDFHSALRLSSALTWQAAVLFSVSEFFYSFSGTKLVASINFLAESTYVID